MCIRDRVYVGKGNFYCSNKDFSFCLWEDNKFFSSKKKKLTKKIAKELLDKGCLLFTRHIQDLSARLQKQ